MKHGKAFRGQTDRTYTAWKNMRARAGKHAAYLNRAVDPRWSDFANFLADMGEAPEGLTLDRIDNALGYSPDNCRWADRKTQNQNRDYVHWLELNGQRMTLTDAAAAVGFSRAGIRKRAAREGVSLQTAFETISAALA